MSDDDKIAEIRTRHEVGPRGHLPVVAYAVANADRGFLLAEVERLRWALEVEGLRLAACDVVAMADTPESADRARQMQSGLRSAALSSVERRVDEVIALRAENERLRKALQDIAEDCEDDYPPSHGAIKYAVQDALRGNP